MTDFREIAQLKNEVLKAESKLAMALNKATFTEVNIDHVDSTGERYIDAYFSDDDEDSGIVLGVVDTALNVKWYNGFEPNKELHANVLEAVEDAKELQKEDKQELVDKVMGEMKEDFKGDDHTAIDEMLMLVPKEILEGYLPEN